MFAWAQFASVCSATTYFSDFITGDDANAGTSTSAPWKRMPGMVNETIATNLVAGDIVCLKGGVTWSDVLIPSAEATYASIGGGALDVLSACVGWGTGKAVIDVPLATASQGAILFDGTSDNVRIDGLIVKNRDNVNPFTRCGIYIEGTDVDHVIFPRIQFNEVTSSESGVCVAGYTDRFYIWNNTLHDNDTSKDGCNSSGIYIGGHGATDVNHGIVEHNDIYNNGPSCWSVLNVNSEGRGITFQTGGTTMAVFDNTIWNNGAWPDGAGVDAGGVTEVDFYANEVTGYEAAEIKAGSNNWTIYGNLFENTGAVATMGYGEYLGTESTGLRMTHNTVVNLNTTNPNGSAFNVSSPGTTNVIANNAFVCKTGTVGPAIAFIETNGWSQSTWDNHFWGNHVQGCTSFSDEVTSGGAHTFRTLLTHQLAYPLQALATLHHVDLGIETSNPFRLKITSPLKEAALIVPVMCIDVRFRPCSSPPDIGAYQSTSGDPAATRTVRN